VVAPVHKNTNLRLILIVCDVIFVHLQTHNRRFLEVFRGGLEFLDPKIVQDNLKVKKVLALEKPLEVADYVFFPHKKIASRTFRISGT
jgi:hypothetical protein